MLLKYIFISVLFAIYFVGLWNVVQFCKTFEYFKAMCCFVLAIAMLVFISIILLR